MPQDDLSQYEKKPPVDDLSQYEKKASDQADMPTISATPGLWDRTKSFLQHPYENISTQLGNLETSVMGDPTHPLAKQPGILGMTPLTHGASPMAAQIVGGPAMAPIHAAQSLNEFMGGHPVKGINKGAQAIGDVGTLIPSPTIIPRAIGAIAGSKIGSGAASMVTDDPDYQALAGNIGGAAGAAPEAVPKGLVRGAAKTVNALNPLKLAGYATGVDALKNLQVLPESATNYGLKPIEILQNKLVNGPNPGTRVTPETAEGLRKGTVATKDLQNVTYEDPATGKQITVLQGEKEPTIQAFTNAEQSRNARMMGDKVKTANAAQSDSDIAKGVAEGKERRVQEGRDRAGAEILGRRRGEALAPVDTALEVPKGLDATGENKPFAGERNPEAPARAVERQNPIAPKVPVSDTTGSAVPRWQEFMKANMKKFSGDHAKIGAAYRELKAQQAQQPAPAAVAPTADTLINSQTPGVQGTLEGAPAGSALEPVDNKPQSTATRLKETVSTTNDTSFGGRKGRTGPRSGEGEKDFQLNETNLRANAHRLGGSNQAAFDLADPVHQEAARSLLDMKQSRAAELANGMKLKGRDNWKADDFKHSYADRKASGSQINPDKETLISEILKNNKMEDIPAKVISPVSGGAPEIEPQPATPEEFKRNRERFPGVPDQHIDQYGNPKVSGAYFQFKPPAAEGLPPSMHLGSEPSETFPTSDRSYGSDSLRRSHPDFGVSELPPLSPVRGPGLMDQFGGMVDRAETNEARGRLLAPTDVVARPLGDPLGNPMSEGLEREHAARRMQRAQEGQAFDRDTIVEPPAPSAERRFGTQPAMQPTQGIRDYLKTHADYLDHSGERDTPSRVNEEDPFGSHLQAAPRSPAELQAVNDTLKQQYGKVPRHSGVELIDRKTPGIEAAIGGEPLSEMEQRTNDALADGYTRQAFGRAPTGDLSGDHNLLPQHSGVENEENFSLAADEPHPNTVQTLTHLYPKDFQYINEAMGNRAKTPADLANHFTPDDDLLLEGITKQLTARSPDMSPTTLSRLATDEFVRQRSRLASKISSSGEAQYGEGNIPLGDAGYRTDMWGRRLSISDPSPIAGRVLDRKPPVASHMEEQRLATDYIRKFKAGTK